MNNGEEFEKWARCVHLDKAGFSVYAAWKARQPEIDALKAEVDYLRQSESKLVRLAANVRDVIFDDADNETQVAMIGSPDDVLIYAKTRIEDLKAELERLRKDAERYRFLRAQNESPVDENGAESFYVGSETIFESGGWVGVDLDSVIDAAMKETK